MLPLFPPLEMQILQAHIGSLEGSLSMQAYDGHHHFPCCGHEQCGMISTQPECLQNSLLSNPGERAHKKCNKDAFELGVVAQACGPSTWEAEEGVSGIQGQS